MAGLCSNNLAMPTLQSRGSNPLSSNRFAILHTSSSSYPSNLGGLPPCCTQQSSRAHSPIPWLPFSSSRVITCSASPSNRCADSCSSPAQSRRRSPCRQLLLPHSTTPLLPSATPHHSCVRSPVSSCVQHRAKKFSPWNHACSRSWMDGLQGFVVSG